MELPAGAIWVGAAEGKACIKVQGRATHLHGPPLRDFAREMIDRGHRRFELNLAKCTYMDSTFLGVLVGISMGLQKLGAGQVCVFRISPRNLELFRTLGINRFFEMESPGSVATQAPEGDLRPLTAGGASPEWAGTLIDAHQLLIEADERNEPRFKELLEFLREDLGSKLSPTLDHSARLAGRWKQ